MRNLLTILLATILICLIVFIYGICAIIAYKGIMSGNPQLELMAAILLILMLNIKGFRK